jgi:Integrase core domain
VAESFFATLKKELVHRHPWSTRRELTSEVFEYLEGFYNRTRRHSRLGMLSPADYQDAQAPLACAGAREKSVHNPSGYAQHDDDNE